MNTINETLINSGASRCLGCKNPFCAKACPIGNDIPEFIKLVKNGEYEKASRLFSHPFAAICGYVCHSPCVAACVLNGKKQPVRFSELEREICTRYPYVLKRENELLKGKNIAVVGGGVSGLTFAALSHSSSANVTVYEKDELLSTLKLIPSFRLPKEAINCVENCFYGKINVIKQRVDKNGIEALAKENFAVYVAVGRSEKYSLGVTGEELAVPYDVFLKNSTAESKVAVVGGGNTALDCARHAKRLGAEVTVVYRRSEADMPAFADEIEAAKREGVNFLFNFAPVKLEKEGGLKLTAAKTRSEGRGKLTVTDCVSEIYCGEVVSAIGSFADRDLFEPNSVSAENGAGYQNVLTGGDFCGKSLVSEAVADAKNAFLRILNKR